MIGLMRRRVNVGEKQPVYLMTAETNPEVLAVCYAQGWCASPDYMTYEEAARVKNAGAFANNTEIKHFDEFEYFSSVTSFNFRNCSKIQSIKLPSHILMVGGSTFNGCSKLESMTVPSSVTSIGTYAFYQCRALTSITFLSVNPPTLGNSSALNYTGGGGATYPIYVPAESVEEYKAANIWSNFSGRIFAIPT